MSSSNLQELEKLSDVVKAIEGVKDEADIEIDGRITVVDGKKAKIYLKNFGEFFNNQVEHASTIVYQPYPDDDR